MNTNDRIEAGSCALLLLDLQAAIISYSPLAPSGPEAVGRLNAAVDHCALAVRSARSMGVLVVHVRVAFSPGHPEANPHSPMLRFMRDKGMLIEGNAGTAFDPRVAPMPGEIVVTKHAVSAFGGTPLDQILRGRGAGTIVIGGLVTHYAVDGTARDAHDRGFRVIVLEDACASATPARHDASLANLAFLAETVTTEAFISSIKASCGDKGRVDNER